MGLFGDQHSPCHIVNSKTNVHCHYDRDDYYSNWNWLRKHDREDLYFPPRKTAKSGVRAGRMGRISMGDGAGSFRFLHLYIRVILQAPL